MTTGANAQARESAHAGAGSEIALANCEFSYGELRGTTLSLFPASLVHSGTDFSESLRLDHIGALRVGFERDFDRMTRGGLLLLAAVALLAAFRPMQALLGAVLGDLTVQSQGGSAFLIAALQAMEFSVSLLPALAAGLALWASGNLAFGWIGKTVLVVVIAPAERVYASRGRDAALVEFAGTVGACLDARRAGRG